MLAIKLIYDYLSNFVEFLHIKFKRGFMPRDFKSFVNENKSKLNENPEKVNEYQNIIDKYKDMDNAELMQNLMQEATKLKQQGKLDSSQLDSLSSTLSPFLNSQQKEMLNSIIKAIDS